MSPPSQANSSLPSSFPRESRSTNPLTTSPGSDNSSTTSDDFDLADLPIPARFLSSRRGDSETNFSAPIDDSRTRLPQAPPGYDLLARIGSGGMGSVFLAFEHSAERQVAIKFLHAPSSLHAFERFLVEVRSLAALNHPNIVKVIHVETKWREPFFTMEYAPGGTLADLVKDNQPLADHIVTAQLMLGAAEAIAAAHAANILHRDLKPSNILLSGPLSPTGTSRNGTRQGHSTVDRPGSTATLLDIPIPKVSDFGLAKRTDRDDGLTRTGPIGTASYMSPEAADGRFREIGSASDVYGLGATLYHLITGRPPFHGSALDETVRQVLSVAPTRPRALRPEIPAGLEAIALKALEKDPADRYPTAAAFADDLRRFLTPGQVPVAPLMSRQRRARKWLKQQRTRIAVGLAAGLVAVGLIALGTGFALDSAPQPQPKPDPREVLREELTAGRGVRLLEANGQPRWAGWPLGPAELNGTSDNGGTCTIQSRDVCVLLLLDDPGLLRYRVAAEICERSKVGLNAPTPYNPYMASVGLVFGYGMQDGVRKTRAHSMLLVGYSEFGDQPKVPDHRAVSLSDVGVVDPPLQPRRIFTKQRLAKPIDCLPNLPWRKIGAVVTPEDIQPLAPDSFGVTRLPDVTRGRAELARDFVQTRLTLAKSLPDWSPRMPIGIWCNGAWVDVRNVTIEPLK